MIEKIPERTKHPSPHTKIERFTMETMTTPMFYQITTQIPVSIMASLQRLERKEKSLAKRKGRYTATLTPAI